MTCQDAIALLSEYLELALGAEPYVRISSGTSAGCAPCVADLNTFRATRRVTAQAGRVEMPDEMKVRLRSFLLDRLR